MLKQRQFRMFAWMISENLPAQKSQSSRFAEAKALVSLFLSWAVNSLKTGHITHLCFPHSTQNNVLVTFNVKTFIGDSFYLRSFRPQLCFWRVFPKQRARWVEEPVQGHGGLREAGRGGGSLGQLSCCIP